jgi:hypothetical protein
MPKRRNVNYSEMNANSALDRAVEPRQEHFGDSPLVRGAEAGRQAEIELLLENLASKTPQMLERIKHDLHAAQNALPADANEARKRLAKLNIPESWPVELLGVIESRLTQARLGLGVESLSAAHSPGREAFNNLFKEPKADEERKSFSASA